MTAEDRHGPGGGQADKDEGCRETPSQGTGSSGRVYHWDEVTMEMWGTGAHAGPAGDRVLGAMLLVVGLTVVAGVAAGGCDGEEQWRIDRCTQLGKRAKRATFYDPKMHICFVRVGEREIPWDKYREPH